MDYHPKKREKIRGQKEKKKFWLIDQLCVCLSIVDGVCVCVCVCSFILENEPTTNQKYLQSARYNYTKKKHVEYMAIFVVVDDVENKNLDNVDFLFLFFFYFSQSHFFCS